MKESSEEKSKPVDLASKPVPLLKLFRYATCLDVLLMVLGTIAAFLHGAAFPIAMFIFGDITNAFLNREATQEILLCSPDDPQLGPLLITNSSFFGTRSCSAVYTYSDITTGATCSNFTLLDSLQLVVGSSASCLTNDLFINEIDTLIYIFIGIACGAFLFALLQTSLFRIPAERQVLKIRLHYYSAALKQDLGWFDVNALGKTSSNLSSGVDKIYGAMGDNLSILIQWVSTFLAAIVVGLVREYRLSLLLLAVVPIMVLSTYANGKVGGIFSNLEQAYYALAGGVAQEVLGSIRTVQAFGGEKREKERYDVFLKGSRKNAIYKGMAVGASVGSIYFVVFLVYSVSFWFGGYLVSEGLAQAGDIITVFFSILIGAFYLGQSGPNLQKLAEAQGVATPIYEIIDRVPTISNTDEGIVPENFKADIELRGVNFSFPARPDHLVLKDLNLKIDGGEKLALVGGSGSGKSTVIKLIQRLYNVDSGEVLVGGVNVKKLNLKWLRSQIGVVSQEPVLFDTSIAENIRYGREEATEEDIIEAAKKANAHNFISALPNGYSTNVGEGGTQLSGGQKQRVAIARALVRNPRILLLDEATSALDTEAEKVVQEALDNASENRTTITIAHRLSTIKDVHLVASIDNGAVSEIGTHSELISKGGLYHDLVVAQYLVGSNKRRAANDRGFVGHSRSVYALSRRQSQKRKRGSILKSMRTRTLSDPHKDQRSESRPLTPMVTFEEDAEDFAGSYTLVVDDPTSEPESSSSISTFRLLRMNYQVSHVMFVGCLAAILNGMVFPAFSIIFGEVLGVFSRPLDEILNGIHPWAAAFLSLGIFSSAAVFMKFLCFNVSGANMSRVIRSTLFGSLLQQEVGWHDLNENSTASLSSKLEVDSGQVQGLVGIRIGTLMESGVALVLSLAIAFGYSWLTALVVVGFMPVLIIATLVHFAATSGGATQDKNALNDAIHVAKESFDNIKTVITFGLESSYYREFRNFVMPSYKRALALSWVYGITYGLSQSSVYFGYIITFRFGAYQVIEPTDSFAFANYEDVYRVFAAIIFASLAIGAAGAFIPDASVAKASAREVFDIIDRSSRIDGTSEKGMKPDSMLGNIQFQHVYFTYPSRPDFKVLKNFNITSCATEKKTLALVGASGSGKSTVMSLIGRMYDPSAGSVSIDGNNLKELNLKWLRSKIGVVSQEPVLFDTSIAENIRYGREEATEEDIIEAAKKANAHNFISSLPDGYDTDVGGKGAQLSGGQKQRIAIARALVRDPKILLLDEATSALDTESEKVVQEALDKAREGRTTIVIAHRLSTIQNADFIAVLENGALKEIGSHDQLLTNEEGAYYKMVYSQNKAWRKGSTHMHLKPPAGISDYCKESLQAMHAHQE